MEAGKNPDTPNQGTPVSPTQTDPHTDTSIAGGNPTVNPADNPTVDTTPEDDSDKASKTEELYAARENLSPSEVPAVNDLPVIVGLLLHEREHGSLPEPLADRFPDDNDK